MTNLTAQCPICKAMIVCFDGIIEPHDVIPDGHHCEASGKFYDDVVESIAEMTAAPKHDDADPDVPEIVNPDSNT